MSVHFLYDVGDTIAYTTFSGAVREVVVTQKLDDIKNGEPGFDGWLRTNAEYDVWGYDRQIIAVIKKKGVPA